MNLPRTLTRLLRRDPGFSVVAIVTLALGIGATVTIFAVVNGILFESLSYPAASRLIALDHEAPGLDLPSMGVSRKLYLHYSDNSTTLEDIALRDESRLTLTGEGEPERVESSAVTPSFFHVLGVAPMLGRTFLEEEGRPDGQNVVVLSYALWKRRFGGDESLVGRTIQVDSLSHEVVGLMPASFVDRDIQIYRPRRIDPNTEQLGNFHDQGLARLARGVPIESARADLERLSTGLTRWFPEDEASEILDRAEFKATVEPLLESIVGELRQLLWLLMGTVAMILTIACANVANLFLVRVEERGQELGIRSALGAGRGRMIREILAESLTLAWLGGVVGVALAQAGVKLLQRFGPDSLPRLEAIAINARVLAFALVVSAIAGLLFGLLPALRSSTERVLSSLRDGTRSASTGKDRHRTRSVLVASQVALGMVLLVGCGLLVRTLLELRAADPGFDPRDTLTFRVTLPESDYPETDDIVAFAESALERIRALPGVRSAGLSSTLPMSGQTSGSGYAVEDSPPTGETLPPVFMEAEISDGFLETIGARLLEGRWLEVADAQQRTGNLLVSRSIRERFWPDSSALGKRIYPSRNSEDDPWYTVVGVVDDMHMLRLDEEPRDLVMKPLRGLPEQGHDIQGNLAFAVRGKILPESLVAALRAEIWTLDPNVPITQVKTMERRVEESRGRVSFTVVILLLASGLALLLAAIGLYGVVSYVVSRRTHEIGIRLAMGAVRGDIVLMVLRGGMAVSLAGAGVGLVLAFGAVSFLDSMLYEVSAHDPATFVVVPLILLLVSALASWLPAQRASEVEPVTALRQD